MFEYTRYEFLEIFDSENVIVEEAHIAVYAVSDKRVTLYVYLAPFDGCVSLILCYKDSDICVCSIGLDDVIEVKIDRCIPKELRLVFYQEGEEEPIAVSLIKPYIALKV